jgi:hypothetical protein
MSNKRTTAQRVAENIKQTYGEEKLLYLVNQFAKGTPGPEIAKAFGVTRQRVNQWKNKLGTAHVTYVLAPEVERIIKGESALSTRVPC